MIKYYIVDAFTEKLFSGNQAGVCILDRWMDDSLMQQIASENNLAETAFIVKKNEDYELRWFTPEIEIDLCGHATLAAAFIISNYVDTGVDVMNFHTQSGLLTVTRRKDILEMNFPSRPPKLVTITSLMEQSIGVPVLEAYLSRDLLLLVEDEKTVKTLSPKMDLLKTIPDAFGVIVTAKGISCDFVSRFFAPKADNNAPEDPVTGSSHTTLIPFWHERLGKKKMIARQLSKRGGTLYCEYEGERVKISGYTKLYLEGTIRIS